MEKVTGKDEETKAIELLQNKEKEKIENFQNAFQSLCKEYGLGLEPVFTVRNGGVQGNLEVVKL